MEITAGKIAELVGGCVEGDAAAIVNSFAKIEEGHSGAISFLANPKYTHYIYSTKSSVVLVADDFKPEHPIGATLIRVADPYATVAKLMSLVDSKTNHKRVGIEQPCFIAEGVTIPEDAYVGAFAYIGKDVEIGAGAQIYPQTYIGDGVKIGADTILYAGVKIYSGCCVGAGCILHSGSVVGADGFGFALQSDGSYSKIPQMGNVIIDDNVEIGANTTVDRAVMGSTHIHQGVKLDNLIQIAHNCEVGANTAMASQSGVAGSTKIGSNCMIGGQVGIVGHSSIGDNVHIGAQSGVAHSEKGGQRLMGSPATDFGSYARMQVMLKRLPRLYDDVAALKRKDKQENK